ncbi:hypothetical protein BH23CHL5_BH23CHL5_07580 [soil metagenome]
MPSVALNVACHSCLDRMSVDSTESVVSRSRRAASSAGNGIVQSAMPISSATTMRTPLIAIILMRQGTMADQTGGNDRK